MCGGGVDDDDDGGGVYVYMCVCHGLTFYIQTSCPTFDSHQVSKLGGHRYVSSLTTISTPHRYIASSPLTHTSTQCV